MLVGSAGASGRVKVGVTLPPLENSASNVPADRLIVWASKGVSPAASNSRAKLSRLNHRCAAMSTHLDARGFACDSLISQSGPEALASVGWHTLREPGG